MGTLIEEEKSINDLKSLEEELRQSEQINSAFFNIVPDMVFLIHKDGTYLDYHVKDETELLVPPGMFVGRNVREVMPPEIADEVFARFSAADKSRQSQCFKYNLEMDGFDNTFECRIVSIGKDKFLSVVRNVTWQKLALRGIAESEKRFEAQYKNNPIPTYIWTKTGDDFELTDFNYAAQDAETGGEILLGTKASGRYAKYPVILEAFNQCFDEKKSVEIEIPDFLSNLEEEKYLYLTYVFLPPDMVMLHTQDLTHQKRTLKELNHRLSLLQEANEEITVQKEEIATQFNQLKLSRSALETERRRYLELFDSSPDGYWLTDHYGNILEVNRTAALMLEENQNHLKGFPITVFFSPDDQKIFRAILSALSKGKKVREFEINLVGERHDEFHAAVTVSQVTGDGEKNLLWIIRNITEQKRARTKLEQSEEFNRRIIESSNDCIKILDLEGNLLYMNDPGRALMEIEGESFIGCSYPGYWSEPDAESLKLEIEKAVAGGVGRYHGHCPTARGTSKWWDVQVNPITDIEGKVERLLVVSRDITEQKLAADKLLQQEKFFRSLIENAYDIIAVLRLDGTIVYESPASEQILGYRAEERIGCNCFDNIHPDDVAAVKLAFNEVIENNHHTHPVEYRYRHKNGSWINLEVIGRISTDDGEPIVIINKRDVTERKIFEEKLRTSEELYRSVVETQTELVCRYLPDTTLTFVNDAYCRYFEKEREKLIGMKFIEFIPENERPTTTEFMKALMADDKTSWIEHEVLQADGSIGWQQWIDHVIRDDQGNVIEIQGIGRDVTEQKQATERLRVSEERFSSFMNNSPVAAWIDDEDGRILFLNSTYRKSIKLPEEDIIGKSITEVFPTETANKYHSLIKSTLDGKINDNLNLEIVRADNSIGTFLAYSFPLITAKEEKRLVGGFAIDITEQQRVEKALSESEEKYRSIVDTMLEGIWIADAEMRIVFVNHQLAEMLGYEIEELLGRSIFDFYDEESRLRAPEILEKRRKGISEYYDAKLCRKNDSRLWVIVSAAPFLDAAGEFAGSIALITDITERKQAEESLREQEELLRGLLALIPDGTMNVLNRDFRYLMAEGRELERIGLSSEMLKGKRLPEVSPKESVEFLLPFYERAFAGEEVWFEFPLFEQIYKMCALPLRDRNDYIYAILVVSRNITEQKQKEEKLQELSARLLNLQDEERRHLARELHDETAQNLAGLSFNIASMKNILSPENEKAFQLLEESEWLTQKSLREVRTLSYLLHPPMLDEGGLISALRWFINGFSARSGIDIKFVPHGEIGRLPSEIETALYRIVQEGMTNIHRHSGSETARIELLKEPDKIVLSIKDKGRGLPESISDEAKGTFRLPGVGIQGMRERLRLLGGHLEINSDKKGTTLTASVPLEAGNL